MKKWKVSGGVLLVLVLNMVAMPSPASAAVATTGSATFNGTANLPKFPCEQPPPFGTGPCSGTFSGQWTGSASGTQGTSAFSVEWTTQTTQTNPPPPPAVSANFIYSEWSCFGGSELGIGQAEGTGSATAGPTHVRGEWQVAGEQFSRPITNLTLTFGFSWARVGQSAVIDLVPVSMKLTVSGFANPVTVISTPLKGYATFVPTSSGSNPHVPSCGEPLTNVKGVIAGGIALNGSA